MTGLYSPINRLMEQVTRPKGTGAEYMTELQKKPGYKPAEAEDRDLQQLMALPQMQREEFMAKLKGQANKFPLKQRELTGSQTHHEQYTLPGGENYREILLHTPMPEGKGFEGVSRHFGGTPNIIASIMAKDRAVPGEMGYTLRNKKSGFRGQHYKTPEEAQAAVQGYPEHLRPMLDVVPNQGPSKKILHLEEIQSDWHQQGRESGYQPADLDKQIAEVAAWRKRLAHSGRRGGYHLDPEDRFEHDKAVEEAEAEHDKLQNLKEMGVPRGPHAKDWHELALKAMIQHAAENGYDQIAINHGKTVADRYGLSKAVKHIDATRYTLPAFGPVADVNVAGLNGAQLHAEHGATEKELAKLLGKELAKKIISQPEESTHRHEGEDLDIGGEGMKGFYDKMVPAFLNKFGKKHGVQVQQGAIDTDQHKVVNDGHADMPHRVSGPEGFVSRHATPEEAQARAAQLNQAPVHTFDITPAMREDVLKNGIPRYAEGGDVSRETADANLAKMLEGNHPSVPKTLYHGTVIRPDTENVKNMGDIHEFDRLFTTKFRRPSIDTVGTWMSDKPGKTGAEMYSGAHKGSAIYPVHASIKNPHETTFELMLRRARLLANGKDDGRMVGTPEVDALRKWLKEMGKDGIIIKHDSNAPNGSNEFENQNAYIALEPHQVKSAIGNRGTYDPKDPDITKAEGGAVKEKVTIPPSMDVMQYELLNRKAK